MLRNHAFCLRLNYNISNLLRDLFFIPSGERVSSNAWRDLHIIIGRYLIMRFALIFSLTRPLLMFLSFWPLPPLNCRWLPIYLADMQLLPTHAPEVYEEFLNGNHPVSRSSQPFSQVWTDMALEQTINLDSKTRGGIVGLTQNASALDRWFITRHKGAELS